MHQVRKPDVHTNNGASEVIDAQAVTTGPPAEARRYTSTVKTILAMGKPLARARMTCSAPKTPYITYSTSTPPLHPLGDPPAGGLKREVDHVALERQR